MTPFTPQFTISNVIAAGLTAIERARGFLEAATLSDEWVRRMSQRALLLEAHYTTHIEGTALTLEESEQLWTGQPVPHAKADDVRELLNYRDAFSFVSEYLESGEPVTEGLIREIHKRLVAGVRGGEADPGAYRRVQNYVVNSVTSEIIHTPPSPQDVPALMQEMVSWLHDEVVIHPILVAGIAQYQLVHVHPFLDGNGRASRLLSTLCLYRAGYDFKRLFTLSEFYDRDRDSFYRAIQSVRKQDMDMTSWLEFFIKGLTTQLAEVKSRGEVAIRTEVVSRLHSLNSRQAAAVDHVLTQGKLTLTNLERTFPEVNRRTLQRDLKVMLDKGVLREVATGPTDPSRHYVLGDKL